MAIAEQDEFERLAPERRRKILGELTAMTPVERLRAIATSTFPLALDALPADLIPLDSKTVSALPSNARAALRHLIGHRRGVWAKLQLLLTQS